MDLFLKRTYFPTATNAEWTLSDGTHLCYNIELPWKGNANEISCIPEMRVELTRYNSPKHGDCLLLVNVPHRGMVEVHEANWAVKQLKGCLAPVTTLDKETPGVGWRSGDACNKLEALIFPVLARGEKVWLNIVKATAS